MINGFKKYNVILDEMRLTLDKFTLPINEDEDAGFDGDDNCTGEEDCDCFNCSASPVASAEDDSDDTPEEKNDLQAKAAFTWLQNVYTPFKLDKEAKEKKAKKKDDKKEK